MQLVVLSNKNYLEALRKYAAEQRDDNLFKRVEELAKERTNNSFDAQIKEAQERIRSARITTCVLHMKLSPKFARRYKKALKAPRVDQPAEWVQFAENLAAAVQREARRRNMGESLIPDFAVPPTSEWCVSAGEDEGLLMLVELYQNSVTRSLQTHHHIGHPHVVVFAVDCLALTAPDPDVRSVPSEIVRTACLGLHAGPRYFWFECRGRVRSAAGGHQELHRRRRP